jgi:DNA-binding NarL/FixJ family response regulator
MGIIASAEAVPVRSRWRDLIEEFKTKKEKSPKVIDERREQYFLTAPLDDIYLTKREHETLMALLQGGSIKSIAREKDISPRTIEEYVKNLRKKLGFMRKQEMVYTLNACGYLSVLQKIKVTYRT